MAYIKWCIQFSIGLFIRDAPLDSNLDGQSSVALAAEATFFLCPRSLHAAIS
jgi:hypothetical protein